MTQNCQNKILTTIKSVKFAIANVSHTHTKDPTLSEILMILNEEMTRKKRTTKRQIHLKCKQTFGFFFFISVQMGGSK